LKQLGCKLFFFTRNDSQLERAQTGRLPPPLVRRDGGARPGEGRHRPPAPLRSSPLQRQGSPPGGVFRLFFVVAVLQHVPDQIEVNFQLQKCQFGPLRDEFRPQGDSQCRGEDCEGAADDGGTPTPQQEAGHPSRVSEKNCLNFGEFYGPVLPHKDFIHCDQCKLILGGDSVTFGVVRQIGVVII
jgi:hypothetical protein